LVRQHVATLLGGVDDEQHRVREVAQRRDCLGLDVVPFVLRAVEEPRRVDDLVANPVVVEVADVDRRRRERVGLDGVARVSDRVDERGLPHVGVARDDDCRFVRTNVRERLEFVTRGADFEQVVLDFLDDVGHPGERLFAVLARGVGVGVPDLGGVLVADRLDLSAGPRHLAERLSQAVDVDDSVGEFVVERVDVVEIGPGGHDVLEVVREDVAGRPQHRLLRLVGRLRTPRPRRPGERLVQEFLRPGGGRKIFESH